MSLLRKRRLETQPGPRREAPFSFHHDAVVLRIPPPRGATNRLPYTMAASLLPRLFQLIGASGHARSYLTLRPRKRLPSSFRGRHLEGVVACFFVLVTHAFTIGRHPGVARPGSLRQFVYLALGVRASRKVGGGELP